MYVRTSVEHSGKDGSKSTAADMSGAQFHTKYALLIVEDIVCVSCRFVFKNT